MKRLIGGLLSVALLGTACSSMDDDPAASSSASSVGTNPTLDSSVSTEQATSSITSLATTTTTAEQPPDSVIAGASTPVRPIATGPSPACASGVDPGVGLQSAALESGGLEYRYQWTVPSTAGETPLPVVLDFHGIGSNGPQQAVLSGFTTLAETEGFVAVQPTGRSTLTDSRSSWELPQFDTDERDDVAFVIDLLERLGGDVCIDRSRIYSTGMSNGGFFTSVLVCELSEVIAAAVSVAGVTHDDSCEPTRPVPFLAFHGTDDTVVPYSGGGESVLTGGVTLDFFEQVMPDEFAEFAADFGCAEPIDSSVTAEVTLREWTTCDGGIKLGFYTVDGGGHTWPGSPASDALAVLGVTNMDVAASSIAWRFFSGYSLDGDA